MSNKKQKNNGATNNNFTFKHVSHHKAAPQSKTAGSKILPDSGQNYDLHKHKPKPVQEKACSQVLLGHSKFHYTVAYCFYISLLLQTIRSLLLKKITTKKNIHIYTSMCVWHVSIKSQKTQCFTFSPCFKVIIYQACHWSPDNKSLNFHLNFGWLPKSWCIPGQRSLPLYPLKYLRTCSTSEENKEEATVGRIL